MLTAMLLGGLLCVSQHVHVLGLTAGVFKANVWKANAASWCIC